MARNRYSRSITTTGRTDAPEVVKMIIKQGNPLLSQIAVNVTPDTAVNGTIDRMFAALTAGRGIGLAATQIGECKRIIIVHTDDYRQVFINPVITKSYGGRVNGWEGCLSFPGQRVKVLRYKQIIVEGYTPDWKPIRRKLKGLAARVVQHEVDHLNGVTIV